MKALSLLQPWASLWLGPKHVETRSWNTSYRGALAIHASKRFWREDIELSLEPPFSTAIHGLGYNVLAELPLGAIIGVTSLKHVGTIINDQPDAPYVQAWPADRILIRGDEATFGNYEPGRYGWVRGDVFRLPEPVPCLGARGLWDVPEDVLGQVLAQLPGDWAVRL